MNEFAGAVDLSGAGKTLGPKEAEALVAELKMMAQTREFALRDRAAAEAENEGFNQLLAALVHLFGEPDQEAGGKQLVVTVEQANDATERVASFHIAPGPIGIVLEIRYAHFGSWEVTGRVPSDEERLTLPVYEELPAAVTRPGTLSAIVQTKRGMRVAEWTPRP